MKTSQCKNDPTQALRRVIVDALAVLIVYVFLTNFLDRNAPPPNVEHIITFLCVWIPSMYFLRAIDCEHAEQLPRVAFWTMAAKMFTPLASP